MSNAEKAANSSNSVGTTEEKDASKNDELLDQKKCIATPSFVISSAHSTIRATLQALSEATEVSDEYMSQYRRLLMFLDVHTQQEDEVIFPYFDNLWEGATSNAGLAQEHEIESVWTQLINRKVLALCQLRENPEKPTDAVDQDRSLSILILQQVKAWSVSHRNHLKHEEDVTLELAQRLSNESHTDQFDSNELFRKVISFDFPGFLQKQLPLLLEMAEAPNKLEDLVMSLAESCTIEQWNEIKPVLESYSANMSIPDHVRINLQEHDSGAASSTQEKLNALALEMGKKENPDAISWIRTCIRTMRLVLLEVEQASVSLEPGKTTQQWIDTLSTMSTCAVTLDSCLVPVLRMVHPILTKHLKSYPTLDTATLLEFYQTWDSSSSIPRDFLHAVNKAAKTAMLEDSNLVAERLAEVQVQLATLSQNFGAILDETILVLSEIKGKLLRGGGVMLEVAERCAAGLDTLQPPEILFDTLLPQLMATLKRWGLFYAQKLVMVGLQQCSNGPRYDSVKETASEIVDEATWSRWSEEHLDGEGQLVLRTVNPELSGIPMGVPCEEDTVRSFSAFEYVRVAESVFRTMYESVNRNLNELSIGFDPECATTTLVNLDKILRLTILTRERFAVVETRWTVLSSESSSAARPMVSPGGAQGGTSAHAKQSEKLVGIVRFVRDKLKECISLSATPSPEVAVRHKKLCSASETFGTWVEGIRNLLREQRSIILEICKLLHSRSDRFKATPVYLIDELVHDMVDAIRSEFLDLELPLIIDLLLESRPVESIASFMNALMLSSTKLEYDAIKTIVLGIVGQNTWHSLQEEGVTGEGQFSLRNKVHVVGESNTSPSSREKELRAMQGSGCGCSCTIC